MNVRDAICMTSKVLTGNDQRRRYLGPMLDSALGEAVVTMLTIFFRILNAFLLPFSKILYDEESQRDYRRVHEEQNAILNEMLFPSIDWGKIEKLPSERGIGARPCATEIGTKLFPVQNSNGEIEWTFSEDAPSSELMVQSSKEKKEKVEEKEMRTAVNIDSVEQVSKDEEPQQVNLSSTVSNSSNPESVISNDKLKSKEEDESPLTSTCSLYLSSDQEGTSKLGENEEGKVYNCPHCDASFKIRGYLTRHIKKHAVNKAYTCPFHKISIYVDENNITHKCHPTGGFSRRDTYKTHLKSRHFKYPKGTKTKDRSNTPGNCSMCGEYFQNSEIWSEIHIEGCECKYLPAGFKGKSIIKNRLRKQLSKQKPKGIDFSTYDMSRFADSSGNVSPPSISFDNSVMSYEYNDINSPTFSISSSSRGATHQLSNSESPQNNGTNSPLYVEQKGVPSENINARSGNFERPYHNSGTNFVHYQNPQAEYSQHTPAYGNINEESSNINSEDYDDEFCLDIDQLNKAICLPTAEGMMNYNQRNLYDMKCFNSQPYHTQHVHY